MGTVQSTVIKPWILEILGTKYDLKCDVELKDHDGACDYSIKEIRICKTLFEKSKGFPEIENKREYLKKVLRHEIIHAYHMESGFSVLHNLENEEIVDWFAHQMPKIQKTIDSIDIEILAEQIKIAGDSVKSKEE